MCLGAYFTNNIFGAFQWQMLHCFAMINHGSGFVTSAWAATERGRGRLWTIKLYIKDAPRGRVILQPWCPISPSSGNLFPLYKLPALSHFLKETSFLRGRLINTDPQAMIRRQDALSPASSLHIPLSKGKGQLRSWSCVKPIVPTA